MKKKFYNEKIGFRLEKNTYNIGKEYLYWKKILIILEKNTYIGKEYL